ncbi:MAG: gliding motility-associated C-terminal domain-containing protein [Bacteroidia bacterium]|nr:gliding motility-associated C-terminal domain-containing protein [Bacteroidia bacterium]
MEHFSPESSKKSIILTVNTLNPMLTFTQPSETHNSMRPFLRRLILIISIAATLGILPRKAFATHMAGADISYTCLGGNSYRIDLTFYRDCAGSDALSEVYLDFTSASCGQSFQQTLVVEDSSEIAYPCPSQTTKCTDPNSPNPGIKQYIYSQIVNLPAQCNDWIIGWEYCCRNCDITTMFQPTPCVPGSNPGLYIETTLNNLTVTCNSSPVFSNIPIAFVCVGQPFTYNHGVIDPNGDSLVYSLVDPLTSDTTHSPIPYLPGFSATNPITSSTGVTIDPVTGDITFTPTQTEVGVLSVLVQEYRNGVLIGSVIRDMEIYIRPCTNNIPTATGIDGSNSRDTTVCPGTSFCFDVFSDDVDTNQVVTMIWNQGIPGATFTVTGFPFPTGEFCWTAPTVNVSTLPYTFTVTVTDNACPSNGYQTYSFNIYVNTPIQSINTTDISCNGAADGTATALTTSPTGNYSYLWSPGGQTTQTITGLAAGNYSVSVIDSVSGCSASATTTITDPPVITDSIYSTGTPCTGNGFAVVFASGGTGAYSYIWNTVPPTLNDTVSGLSAGTYFVTITDANGCTHTDSVDVATGPSSVVVTVDSVATLNCFTDTTGYASVSATGGTPGYTYVWNTIPVQTGPLATNLSPGLYTVTVTDSVGCSSTQNANVVSPAEIILIGSSTQAGCNLADGSATVSVSGGVPTYTYLWDTLSVTTATLNNVPAGIYNVTVEDQNNCISTLDVSVSNTNIPPPTVTLSSAISCNGSSNAEAVIIPAGGTPPYTFTWDGSASNDTITNLGPGTYTGGVTDGAGCSAFATIVITQPSILGVNIVSSVASCFGENNGRAIVSSAGGTGPYTYSWSPSGGTDSSAFNLPPDTFVVTVTDANGCTATASTIITENTQINILIASTVNATCNGSNDASIDLTTTGTSPLSFNWNQGEAFTEDLTNIDAGPYTVVVTDGAGCTSSLTVSISQPPAIPVDAGVSTSICNDVDSYQLNANLAPGTTGVWSTTTVGVTFSSTTDPDAMVMNLNPGQTFLTWTVSDGTCQASQSITISYNNSIFSIAGNDVAICDFGSVQLNGNLPSTFTGYWSGFPVTFNDSTLYDATANSTVYGNNELVWTIVNSQCVDSDTLLFVVDEPVSSDAGPFDIACTNSGELIAVSPITGSGQWGVLAPSSATFVDPTIENAQVNGLSLGANVFVWTVVNGVCSASDTTSLFYDIACELELPTGFTPNGDTYNDGYEIKGIEGYPLNVFRVFNRWGNEVYTKEDYKNTDWKGQNNSGNELPEATYFVILEIKNTEIKISTYVDLRKN